MRMISARSRRRAARMLAIAAAAGVVAQGAAVATGSPVPAGGPRLSLAPPPAGSAAAAALRVRHGLGAPPGYTRLPGHHAARVARPTSIKPWQMARPAPAPVFPASGSAVVTMPPLAGRAAGATAWARAGSLPVQVAAASPAAGSAPAGSMSRVNVTVASHAAARAAGADGVLFTLQRADAATRPARVRVRVSYARFASAYGGGLGPRLALFAVPTCSLTTPKARACQTETPVAAVNDWKARTLSATVTVASAGTAPLVLAAASTTSGGSGDFKATSLAPSSQWQVGLQSGDFTWSYPLRMPPPIAGAAPSLSLSYDSQASDGETAQANTQPGQLGEGFSLAGGGFIERKYASCADHVGDSSNNTGESNKTGDLCWDGNNAVLSMAGHSGQIVLDTGGTWHLGSDDGSTVKLLSGGTSNGAYNNSHWEIITPDGTQYWFGLNELPGWTSGDQVTNSVWTVPVVGLRSVDPGNTPGSYANSVVKNMAWRWNLDLVVDPNGNATSYYYTPQTNYYASDSTSSGLGSTWLQYDSGGRLSEIYYGSQDNTANGNNVYAHRPFHVTFGYSDRCTVLDSSGNVDNSTCDANHSSQTDWPDTPWDLFCGSSSGCTGWQHDAPTFFDTQMLTSVTTSLYEGSNPYQNVDTWTLRYDWLAADVNSDLALASITHSGVVGGTVKLPDVAFGWTSMDNRVPYDTATYPAMGRYRMTSVISETGAQTSITYHPASCASSAPDPTTNTLPCFQQEWAPGDLGGTPTTTSWFYKYTVSQVKVDDATGGQPPLVTSYTYCDTSSPQCASNPTGSGGAWHYDTDIDLVPAKDKSYGQWRGYRYVHVITGDSSGTQSETDYTFLRGMDGNPVNSNGSWTYSPVTFRDSQNDQVTDSNQWNGFQLEKITYNGPGGARVSDQVGLPWASLNPTATSANQPWGKPLTAWLTGTAETDTYTPLSAHAGGGSRHTQVKNTFDNTTGLLTKVTDNGDLAVPTQALCTTYTYPSPASTAGLIDYPDEIKTIACGTSSTPTVSDTKNSYDGQAFGAAPTAGNVTETDVYSSGDPGVTAHWVKQYRGSYDSYGRMLTSEDADGACTSTSYTSAYGAGHATTSVTVASPLTGIGCGSSSATYATTTTNLNPAWGSPTTTVDANIETTTYCNDPLGRVTAVWLSAQASPSCAAANIAGAEYTFAYSVTATMPPYVATTKLVLGSIPITSYQIYDSLLRPRQTQAPAEGPNGGTEVTDTLYDSRGNAVTQNGPYNANTTASGSLWHTTEPQVPNETAVTYDGVGRQVESDFDSGGSLLWKTTWSYPGADAVTVTPPSGGTITTTYADARGRTTEIDQYHSKTSASGAYDATSYGYAWISGGSTETVTDAGGNAWTWTNDLLGREVSAADPDTGTTASTWNDLGQLTSTTDAAGKTISWTYDAADRKTGQYAAPASGQSTSNQLAAWTYDTPAVGQPSSATAYVSGTGGEAYKQVVNSYDTAYQPTSTTYTIPSNSVTGSLAGSYTVTASYNLDGTPATLGYPAAGPLAAETVNFGYDNKGLPYSEWSSSGADASDYAEQSVYTPWGAPAEIDRGTSTSARWSRMLYSYDGASLRLTQTRIQREANSWANDTDTSYTYDSAGNVTSATDSVTGDNQCYQYDYLARLTVAWAQPSATCASSPPGASGLGGPAPYRQTLSYDNRGAANGSTSGTTGNITDSTLITGSGSSATTADISYADQYPAYGAAQPHAAAGYTTTTNGNAVASSQTWTKPGQLASITTGGTTSSYNWNGTGMVPGQLAAITAGSTTTSYRYDASGNLLVRKDGSTSRLYLPGEELSASGSTISATRYYSLGGKVIAARTGSTAVTWLFSDPHGTATVEVNPAAAVSSQLSWRWYTPFGQFRPPIQGTWPGTRRFADGTYDSATGLTNLGAREYNPATPAFISPDPILNLGNPADLNPYDYAANNPATNSDPSGLVCVPGASANANCNDPGSQNPPSGGGQSSGGSGQGTSGSGTFTLYGPPGDHCTPSTCTSSYRSHLSPAQQFIEGVYNGQANAAQRTRALMQAYDQAYAADGSVPKLQWSILFSTCRQFGCSPQVMSALQWQATGGGHDTFPWQHIPVLGDVYGIIFDLHDHNYLGSIGYAGDLALGFGLRRDYGKVAGYILHPIIKFVLHKADEYLLNHAFQQMGCIPAFCWTPMDYHLYNDYVSHVVTFDGPVELTPVMPPAPGQQQDYLWP